MQEKDHLKRNLRLKRQEVRCKRHLSHNSMVQSKYLNGKRKQPKRDLYSFISLAQIHFNGSFQSLLTLKQIERKRCLLKTGSKNRTTQEGFTTLIKTQGKARKLSQIQKLIYSKLQCLAT